MTVKRLKGADRRALILQAATKVFAEHGPNASTQMLAAAAKVSDALIFAHFGSKRGLYKAVLRGLIEEQDASFKAIGLATPDTEGLVAMLTAYFQTCLQGSDAPSAQGIRILFTSLAGDGEHARLTYKRAIRLSLKPLKTALDAARDKGDLRGQMIAPENLIAFLEHVGSMLVLSRGPEKPIIAYAGDDADLLRQLVWFAGRGLGLTEAALQRCYAPKPNMIKPAKSA
jgi:AcrR family transcriptional regulator